MMINFINRLFYIENGFLEWYSFLDYVLVLINDGIKLNLYMYVDYGLYMVVVCVYF